MNSGLASSLEASIASTVSLPEEDGEELEEHDHKLRKLSIKNVEDLHFIQLYLRKNSGFRHRLIQQLRGIFKPSIDTMVHEGMQKLLDADFVRNHSFNKPNRPAFQKSPLFQCLLDAVRSRFQHGCSTRTTCTRVSRWISLARMNN